MKITKSLAIAAGLVIGGLNVSAKTMGAEQTAQKETAEIKADVTGITPDEENQILTIEQEHAKSIQLAQNTVTGKALRTQKKQLCNDRDVKIKATLTASQFREYRREKRYAYHNTRWLGVYYVTNARS